MKHLAPLFGAAVCIIVLGATSLSAQTSRSVAGAGAVSASNGDMHLVGTVGQAAIGHALAVATNADIGFWHTQRQAAVAGLTGDNVHQGLELSSSPNPFSKSTTLSFSVPVSGHVSLVLYNSLGQPMRTLHSGVLDAGSVSQELDLSGLPSGKYTALLRVGERQASTTLLLID